jgi:hypothetical protein
VAPFASFPIDDDFPLGRQDSTPSLAKAKDPVTIPKAMPGINGKKRKRAGLQLKGGRINDFGASPGAKTPTAPPKTERIPWFALFSGFGRAGLVCWLK